MIARREMPVPKLQAIVIAGLAGIALAGCDPSDSQAPAPTESLVPLPSDQPAPPAASPGPTEIPSEPGSTRPAPEPDADECGADKLGSFLNQLPTTDAIDGIREAVGHDRIRTINPGDVVTMDLRPDRLNIEIGEDGRIKLLRCG